MTVKDLKNELSKFDDNLEVMDNGYIDIETVRKTTWTDSNYPFSLPDKEVVIIE